MYLELSALLVLYFSLLLSFFLFFLAGFFPFGAVFADLQAPKLTHSPDICELLMRVFQKVL